jgi:hypothetical protein
MRNVINPMKSVNNKSCQNVVGWGTILKSWEIAGLRHFEISIFSIYQILPATLGPGFDSASDRNE